MNQYICNKKWFLSLISLSFFLFIFTSTVYSQQKIQETSALNYNYLFSFETKKGKDEKPTGKPRTVAINSIGYIYVVIPYAKEVRVYKNQGEYLFSFGKRMKQGEDKRGCFSEPSGVAIDSEDRVYVTDLDRDMVLIYDASGDFKEEFTIFQPVEKEVKSDACAPFIGFNPVKKALYIPDPCTQRITLYNTMGQFLTSFGEIGSDRGKFGGPANCAFNNKGEVYIVDPGNFRIQYLTPQNEPIDFFGKMGTNEGEFVRPYGIAIDSSGKVFISDIAQKLVQTFDSKGTFLGLIKIAGNQQVIEQPLGMACSKQNRLYVVDGEGLKIHVFQIE